MHLDGQDIQIMQGTPPPSTSQDMAAPPPAAPDGGLLQNQSFWYSLFPVPGCLEAPNQTNAN